MISSTEPTNSPVGAIALVSLSPHTVHALSSVPSSNGVGSTTVVHSSLNLCPKAGNSLDSTNTSLHTVHTTLSVFPLVVHVASLPKYVTST